LKEIEGMRKETMSLRKGDKIQVIPVFQDG
jgi:hypothetical protein